MDWDELTQRAREELASRDLTEEYSVRLEKELYEIVKQGTNTYWCELVAAGTKYDVNPDGLVFPWLLGVTSVDPIEAKIPHVEVYQTDFPDIDLDFLPIARDTIKDFATQKYTHVCSVGNWITYLPKSALQDVARAMGSNPNVVIALTKELPDEFDELQLKDHDKFRADLQSPDTKVRADAHREIARYQPFYDYQEANPTLVDLAFRLVGKIKAQGTHAGGIIIADRDMSTIVPMSYLGPEGKRVWTSQWTEGKKTQLSKFGLVKFDILGVKTIYYIWQAGNLIKKNRGIEIDWTRMDPTADEPFAGFEIMSDGTEVPIPLNDQVSLEQCNNQRTDSVFQIETDIQKHIISQGGVKDFKDLVAYNALGRPGPMEMIPEYIARRDDPNQSWRDTEDPRITEMLESTYGIIVFQEQLQAMWMQLAKFTTPEAESARKIISKKWVDKLPQIEEKWRKGAASTIGEQVASQWWEKMVDFGRYCFNKCIAAGTIVGCLDGDVPIEEIKGHFLETSDGPDLVKDVHYCGYEDIFEIEFSNGVKERVTSGHKYLTDHGYRTVEELPINNHAIKYVSGGMKSNEREVNEINSRRRREDCEAVSSRRDLRQYSSGYKLQSNLRQDDIESDREIRGKEEVLNERHQQSQALLFGRLDSKCLLLDWVSNGRWICKRKKGVCLTRSTTERSRRSLRIFGILQLNEADDTSRNDQIGCIKQEIAKQITRIWCDSTEDRERNNSDVTTPSRFCAGIYGWRWNSDDKWERISDNWIRFEFGIHTTLEEVDFIESTFKRQQTSKKEEYTEYMVVTMDWLRAMQKARCLDVSEPTPISELREETGSGRINIVKITPLGKCDVYSPEMLSDQHNYSIGPDHPIAANSHAVAYSIVTYRCLYLKAHYPAEWWAAVMTMCQSWKLSHYMGAARLDGVKFSNMDCNHLTIDYTVKGDQVIPGLVSVKGAGKKACQQFTSVEGPFTDIDDFVAKCGKSKNIMERLIKLGAFDHVHPNRRGLWAWYQYKYATGKPITLLKRAINSRFAWSQEQIDAERRRQGEAYFALNPKKTKLPKKIVDYKGPKAPVLHRDQVFNLFPNYSPGDILKIEKQFLGYYWTSPLDMYVTRGHTIEDAKVDGVLEAVIESVAEKRAKKSGNKFYIIHVTDGTQSCDVLVWSDVYHSTPPETFQQGVGVRIAVDYNEDRKGFKISDNSFIQPLIRRDSMQAEAFSEACLSPTVPTLTRDIGNNIW